MPEPKPSLAEMICEGCPAVGACGVDPRMGTPFRDMFDSFLQTRADWLDPDTRKFDDERGCVEVNITALRYYDAYLDEMFDAPGHKPSAELGIACAKRVLSGECPKGVEAVINESDIDDY